MLGVAFELAHLQRVAVDVGEQTASRLAVETGRGHEHIAAFNLARPGLRVELDPVIPAFFGRERGQVDSAWSGVEGLAAGLGLGSRRLDSLVQPMDAVVAAHASGTTWPA